MAEVVADSDQSAHAFMIEAIERQTTLAEARKGFVADALNAEEAMLRSGKADRFRGRLLTIDSGVAARWGAKAGESEARGQRLPVIDGLIAATSLQHDLTVVTRNTDDLERCGARCFNPWIGK